MKNNDVVFKQGIVQACTYLRLILREQLDHHFAIVLLLCGEELTVLLKDRSGHLPEDPLDFTQVITAFSTLEPWRIGWDPQMTVYDLKGKASDEIGEDAGFFKLNLVKTRLEINIPRQLKEIGKKVLTLHVLSISSSEVMCG